MAVGLPLDRPIPVQKPIDDPGYFGGGPSRREIKVRSFALDAATVDQEYVVTGNVLAVTDAVDATTKVNIKYNEQYSDGHTAYGGFAQSGIPFTRLYLSWAAQAGKTLEIMTIFDPTQQVLVRP